MSVIATIAPSTPIGGHAVDPNLQLVLRQILGHSVTHGFQYADGDTIFAAPSIDGDQALNSLAIGTPGQVFGITDGLPAWQTPSSYLNHSVLSATHGDTVPSAVVAGDIIIGNAAPAWAALPVGGNGVPLIVNPVGIPAWVAPIPVAGQILHYDGTTTLFTTTLTYDNTTRTQQYVGGDGSIFGAAGSSLFIGRTAAEPMIDVSFTSAARLMELIPGARTITGVESGWMVMPDTAVVTMDVVAGTIGGFFALDGTFEFRQAGSILGAGNMFRNSAMIKNESGFAVSFGSQYTFVCNARYQADGGAISSLFVRDLLHQPVFSGINGGVLTISIVSAVFSNPSVAAGATVTNHRDFEMGPSSVAGTLTNREGLYAPAVVNGTNVNVVRSLLNTGSGRMFINATGTAVSLFSGDVTFDADVIMGGATSGDLTFAVPAVTASHTLTWPSAQGGVGTQLQNDGTGALSWAAASAITGTGANDQVAIWSGVNTLDGSGDFTWDGSTLTVNGKLTVTGLIDPTGMVFTEQIVVPGGAPGAGFGTVWVRDDTPNVLVFTDDVGSDTVIGNVIGTGTAGRVTLWTSGTTVGDDADLLFSGLTLTVGVGGTGIIKAGTGRTLQFNTDVGSPMVQIVASQNWAFVGGWRTNDAVEQRWGNVGNDSTLQWSTAQTNDGLVWGLGVGTAAQSGNMIVTAYANRAVDHLYVTSPDPRLYIASTTTPASNWGSFHHNGTDFVISVGNAGGGTGRLRLDTFTSVAGMLGNAGVPAYTFAAQGNIGMYRSAASVLGWSTDGVERMTLGNTALSLTVFLERSTTATITASTTQSQGQQPLVSDVNEVSVVANVNDVVTMPPATAGKTIKIINNGANTLQLFPASGDNVGGGVDTSITLAAAGRLVLTAYDGTNWENV